MKNEGTIKFVKSSKGNSDDWKASVSEKDTADYTGNDSSIKQSGANDTENTPKVVKLTGKKEVIQKDQITFTNEYTEMLL